MSTEQKTFNILEKEQKIIANQTQYCRMYKKNIHVCYGCEKFKTCELQIKYKENSKKQNELIRNHDITIDLTNLYWGVINF